MNFTRIMAAAALAAGLGIGSVATADASVTATINIVNNNSSTTVYHAKNPPSTQSDSFVGVAGWTTSPPDSLLAGNSDSTMKITLGANQSVTFTFGSPNSASQFPNSCTFTIKANSGGTGLQTPTSSKVGSATSCSINLVSGQAYNVQAALSGF